MNSNINSDTDESSSPMESDLVTDILGVQVHVLTQKSVLKRIDGAIRTRVSLQLGMLNAAKLVNMRRDPILDKDVRSSDLLLADGASILVAARLLGCPLPERVAGIDLMYGILEQGNTLRYRVYCLGATEAVSRKIGEIIRADYPQVELVGRRNGYFSRDEEEGIAQTIANSQADVLLVAMTSPKKEIFMAKWRRKISVPVIHGVGGSFDVMAGITARAPRIWQRLGMEWLYRIIQEPRRLWKRYLVTNLVFIGLLLQELLARLVGTSKQ